MSDCRFSRENAVYSGHAGHGRRDDSHLPVAEEFVALPEESLICPIRGKPAAMMSDTEDSEVCADGLNGALPKT